MKTATHGAALVGEVAKRVFPRGMGRNDLIESAGLKDLRDHAGQRADRKLPRSLLERFRQRQNDAQTRAADIREVFEVDQQRTGVVSKGVAHCTMEIHRVRAIDATFDCDNQCAVVRFDVELHPPGSALRGAGESIAEGLVGLTRTGFLSGN